MIFTTEDIKKYLEQVNIGCDPDDEFKDHERWSETVDYKNALLREAMELLNVGLFSPPTSVKADDLIARIKRELGDKE